MKTTSILLATATLILAACSGDPGAGGASDGTRIVMSADVQKEGVQYFEVTHPSSVAEVVTAFDAKGAVVFSIDYLSNAAHTQRTIALSSARVSRTWTMAETPVSSTASSDGTIRPQMTKECGEAFRGLFFAWLTGDWETAAFYAQSLAEFDC
jgi:hypothetical protein